MSTENYCSCVKTLFRLPSLFETQTIAWSPIRWNDVIDLLPHQITITTGIIIWIGTRTFRLHEKPIISRTTVIIVECHDIFISSRLWCKNFLEPLIVGKVVSSVWNIHSISIFRNTSSVQMELCMQHLQWLWMQCKLFSINF